MKWTVSICFKIEKVILIWVNKQGPYCWQCPKLVFWACQCYFWRRCSPRYPTHSLTSFSSSMSIVSYYRGYYVSFCVWPHDWHFYHVLNLRYTHQATHIIVSWVSICHVQGTIPIVIPKSFLVCSWEINGGRFLPFHLKWSFLFIKMFS